MKTSNRKYTYPFNIEREYVNFLKRLTKELRKNTLNNIDKIYELILAYRSKRQDSEDDEIDEEIDEEIIFPLLMFMSAYVLRQELERLYYSVRSYVIKDLEKEIKGALKNTAEAIEKTARLEEAKYGIEEYKDDFITENMELVQRLTDDYKYKLKQVIKISIENNFDKIILIELIKKKLDEEDRRAELIGVDQIGRATGRLNRHFQQKLGCDRYEWLSMRDSRVRPLHRKYDGNIFYWNKPPADGHPGMAVRCRCKAKPVFDE